MTNKIKKCTWELQDSGQWGFTDLEWITKCKSVLSYDDISRYNFKYCPKCGKEIIFVKRY